MLRLLFLTVWAVVAVGFAMAFSPQNGGVPHWSGSHVDLRDWSRSGHVTVADDKTARLGPGTGSLSQKFPINGAHVVYFGVHVKSAAAMTNMVVRLRCMDPKGRELMNVTGAADPKKEDSNPGVYIKTQALTASIIVSIEKSYPEGEVEATGIELRDESAERKAFRPLIDIDEYMHPIWLGKVVHNETVLMRKDESGAATGHLLFTPSKILTVRDYGLDQTYRSGADYTVSGSTITAPVGSKMPSVETSFFEPGDLKWFTLLGKHVVVTYEHDDSYGGTVPPRQASGLPNTVRLLRAKRRLRFVADGDSITLGNGTSNFSQIPPYMPSWAELAVDGLKKIYRDSSIQLYNTALGGMTSDWGAENAGPAVAALDPDLVLIGFGMNDFWWMPADHFQDNIKAIIHSVRAKNPSAEFILIAPMQFDPQYTSAPQYVDRLKSYAPALKALEGQGVRVLDMTAITQSLYAIKPANDFVADPLHPNDFLARWYAQGVVETLSAP